MSPRPVALIAAFLLGAAACSTGGDANQLATDATIEAPGIDSAVATTTTVPPAPPETTAVADEQRDSPPPEVTKPEPEPRVDEVDEIVEVDDAPGRIEIQVLATPETVDDIVPTVSLDGVDAFATNCFRDDSASFTSEARYLCGDLERAVYQIGAAPVNGVEPELGCAPVGAYDDWDPLVADVGVDGFVYCTLRVQPPGVRVMMFGVDAAAVDSIEIRDLDGQPVPVACRRIDLPHGEYAQSELTLQCDPMAEGSYVIPRQDVDGSGVEQPFVCLPGLGTGNAPDFDNTVHIADSVDEDGVTQLLWGCINEEPVGPIVGLIQLVVEADAALVDDLRIELRQNDVDIGSDACVSAVAPTYLSSDAPGFRFFECRGDWAGAIAPTVLGAPEGTLVQVTCFEQNPVTGVIGPTAILDPEVGEPWICRIDVGV
ncbi:MAG: hypothetical protein QNJ12_21405 [Ilumatobacter sp.]|uniref:hypothetical protein n=1 Tax=Ilumatobacter sp. TaxID=1967498 RepID=UPI0026189356|nr:hypothetical protein [Ilumatobacter sp.]MDJ0771357.1 hypothetical protein [Ilumatobacter sp.]